MLYPEPSSSSINNTMLWFHLCILLLSSLGLATAEVRIVMAPLGTAMEAVDDSAKCGTGMRDAYLEIVQECSRTAIEKSTDSALAPYLLGHFDQLAEIDSTSAGGVFGSTSISTTAETEENAEKSGPLATVPLFEPESETTSITTNDSSTLTSSMITETTDDGSPPDRRTTKRRLRAIPQKESRHLQSIDCENDCQGSELHQHMEACCMLCDWTLCWGQTIGRDRRTAVVDELTDGSAAPNHFTQEIEIASRIPQILEQCSTAFDKKCQEVAIQNASFQSQCWGCDPNTHLWGGELSAYAVLTPES